MKPLSKAIDSTGRLVVPKPVRQYLGVDHFDYVDFTFGEDGSVILKKHEKNCVFCGETDNLREFNGKEICESCFGGIKKMRK